MSKDAAQRANDKEFLQRWTSEWKPFHPGSRCYHVVAYGLHSGGFQVLQITEHSSGAFELVATSYAEDIDKMRLHVETLKYKRLGKWRKLNSPPY